jgi:ABC-type bacteriocin/lantibiotic exporter with double-glycine peptidase domain
LNAAAVRRQIGTVWQHNTMMAGTIFENLVVGGHISTHDDFVSHSYDTTSDFALICCFTLTLALGSA